MYYTNFGLQRRLFDEGVAAADAVFRNRQHAELVEQLKLAFASSTSVVVLRGPAGVGKSTLTSGALHATSTRLALAWLNSTPTNAAELLELLLVELGVNTLRTTRIERLQLWRQFQAEMATTASRLFVVVERTEDLPVEVLHALDSATAADAVGHPGANVILLGHGRIEEHLADPVLDSFRQRIRLRAELKPFTLAEVDDYLRHRVAVAEGNYDDIFAPSAVTALHRFSHGVARQVNNLCETALTLAASRGKKSLTADLVNEAAVTWLGLSAAQPVDAAAAATTATAAPVPRTARAAPVAPSAVAPNAAATLQAPSRPVAPAAPRTPPPPSAPPVAAPPAAVRVTAPATPVTTAATAPPPKPAPRPTPPPSPVQEYDGVETDIPDVSVVEFPVLTEAVDTHQPQAPAAAVAPPRPPPAAVAPQAVAPRPPAAARPPPGPVTPSAPPRLDAAPPAPRAGMPPKPAAASAQPPARPPAPAPQAEEDVLRQTQTMRAISEAKSIVDISDSMAETLFGEAELDFLSASIASAANWDEAGSAPAPKPTTAPTPGPQAKAQPQPQPAKAKVSDDDDLLDLLGLADAPLELIDDSAGPPTGPRKSGTQR